MMAHYKFFNTCQSPVTTQFHQSKLTPFPYQKKIFNKKYTQKNHIIKK